MAARNAFEFIEHLDCLRSADGVWSAFMDFVGQFGFIYGGVANIPGPQQRIKETTLCLSWPEEWRERYFTRNYIIDDPVNLHLVRTNEPFTWQEMLSLPCYTKRHWRMRNRPFRNPSSEISVTPIQQTLRAPR